MRDAAAHPPGLPRARRTRPSALGIAVAAALAVAGAAGTASAFAPIRASDLSRNHRWSAEPYQGAGLHDGIQVAVAPDLGAVLGATPEEIPLLQDAIRAAFAAWESPVLAFDVDFARLPSRGLTPGLGGEIDLFAVESTDPIFQDGSEFFGLADWNVEFVPGSLTTNGQRLDGFVFVRVDIFLNATNIRLFRNGLGLDQAQSAAAIQRLLMHEIGHGLGLGHPNVSPATENLDTDADPLNAMALDPCRPDLGLAFSANADVQAVMSNAAPFEALFLTALRPDDAAGRDALYPVAPAGGCPPPPDQLPEGWIEAIGPRPDLGPVLQGGPIAVDGFGRCSWAVLSTPAPGTGWSMLRFTPAFGLSVRIAGGLGLPRALAADAAGNLALVGNMQGFRIASGGATTALASQLLGGASDVALLPDGTAIVTQQNSDLVVRVSPTGSVVPILTNTGDGVRPLSQPTAVARDPAGNLWVTARGSDNVFRIAPDASITQVLGPGGHAGHPLVDPTAVAVDSQGTVVVGAQGSDVLFRIEPDGSLGTLLAAGETPIPVQRTAGLAFDGMDNLYVLGGPVEGPVMLRRTAAGRVDVLMDARSAGVGGFGDPGPLVDLAVDRAGDVFASATLPQLLMRPATCEPGESAPRLLGREPATQHVGGYLELQTEGLAPDGRVVVGRRPLRPAARVPVGASEIVFVELPLDLPAGSHDVRLMNPAACPGAGSFPVVVDRTPLPAPSCGLLGAEAALLWGLLAGGRWRRRAARR